MDKNAQQALIVYGLHRLAEMTHGDLGLLADRVPGATSPAEIAWDKYETTLAGDQKGTREAVLTCIFSLITGGDSQPARYCYDPQRLSLERQVLFPKPEAQVQPAGPDLWNQLAGEVQQVPAVDMDAFFETFYHLFHKYAWAVPCTYGEPGVSLFEQWKAVAALVAASGETWAIGPAAEFTLIGGDIPGIQDFVYTITSKGAAKGLRGRSFFIQLLGDAVVRRILADLDLGPANVVYNAGGNFVVLGPAGQPTQDTLNELDDDVNRTLLDTYEGDIALCLASITMPAKAAGTAEFGAKYSLELKQAVARQKTRRFAPIANAPQGWQAVFEPKGGGGDRAHFCVICQAELSDAELKDDGLLLVDIGELEPGETAPRACDECATFRSLAEAVGRPGQALYLQRNTRSGGERWQKVLYRLSGWWYRFDDSTKGATSGGIKYVLSNFDFVKLGAHGFLVFANTTPRVTAKDVAWWNETYPDQKGKISVGDIRNFELLAHAAKADGALERVGVLRMDVDDLGRVMTRGLVHDGQPYHTMAATSALSVALNRFFAGYLDVLCQEVTEKPDMAGLKGHPDEGLLYVIYAGGDDLFVVGSWHFLLLLAERVRHSFDGYVGGNSNLHISAGMTLEGRRFPLYQAATRSGKALDGGAKKHEYIENGVPKKKNAVHVLGQTLSWDDFAEVRERADRLAWLVRQQEIPRGLLQTMQRIYNRFVEDQKEARRGGLKGEQVYYGPWMWRQAYYLKRFTREKPAEVEREVKAVQDWTITHRIRYLGLVARWAEYLTRGKEE